MNKLILAAAAVATLGLTAAAHADGRDPAERAAYNETIRNSAQLAVPGAGVVEGRNATVAVPTAGVEPYIQQQIEQNARSTR